MRGCLSVHTLQLYDDFAPLKPDGDKGYVLARGLCRLSTRWSVSYLLMIRKADDSRVPCAIFDAVTQAVRTVGADCLLIVLQAGDSRVSGAELEAVSQAVSSFGADSKKFLSQRQENGAASSAVFLHDRKGECTKVSVAEREAVTQALKSMGLTNSEIIRGRMGQSAASSDSWIPANKLATSDARVRAPPNAVQHACISFVPVHQCVGELFVTDPWFFAHFFVTDPWFFAHFSLRNRGSSLIFPASHTWWRLF